jgi:hypothetical protein
MTEDPSKHLGKRNGTTVGHCGRQKSHPLFLPTTHIYENDNPKYKHNTSNATVDSSVLIIAQL